jgi:hypothetical protein
MHSGATGLQSIFRALWKQVASKDRQKGGENRLFSYSVDCTPSLHVLGDLNAGSSAGEEVQFILEQRQTTKDRTDWVFGCALVPGEFLEESCFGGASF